EMEMPSACISSPMGKVWVGGERGTIAIPNGKPAPFDSFKVVATELLWTWWRSLHPSKSTLGSRPSRSDVNAPETGSAGSPPAIPTPVGEPGEEDRKAYLALMRVFTNGVADERFKKAARLLSDPQPSVNEKLTKINDLIPFPPTASAEVLGEML